MVLYSFKKEDGTEIELFYPMGECPEEVICDDGTKAKRHFQSPNIKWGKGYLPPSVADKRNRDMKKRNEEAGIRMRERWKSLKNHK